jgi:hypothetical protein
MALPTTQPRRFELNARLREVRPRRWLSSQLTFITAIAFLAFGIGVVIGGYDLTFGTFEPITFIREVYSNFGIELIGVGLTVLVIDSLNRRRAEQQLKEALISQMGSRSSDLALDAVRRLQQKCWLRDGSLQGAALFAARLQEADLFGANLQGAVLSKANLQGAMLGEANLQKADLRWSNLQDANLRYANLQGADLTEAHLQRADLRYMNLQGADLTGVNLQGSSKLHKAQFDEMTTLPDGTTWTPDRDLREFTQPAKWQTDQSGHVEDED